MVIMPSLRLGNRGILLLALCFAAFYLASLEQANSASAGDATRVYYTADDDLGVHELSFPAANYWAEGGELGGVNMAAGTSPASFKNDAGDPRVYIVGTDHLLREVSWNSWSGWASTVLPSRPVAAGTSPAAFKMNDGSVRVLYVAADSFGVNRLWEISWHGSWVATPDPISSAVAPGTSPSAFMNSSNLPRAYFVTKADTQGNSYIHETGWNPGRDWGEVSVPTYAVAPSTSPSAFATSDGGLRVYYVRASDNLMYQSGYVGATGWMQWGSISPDAVAPGTSASSFLIPVFDTPRVYFVGNSDKRFREASWSGTTGWVTREPPSRAVASGTSPSAVNNSNGGYSIYYVAADSLKVRRTFWTTATTDWVESPVLSSAVDTGSSPSAIINGAGQARVYYSLAQDHRLHEASYNSSLSNVWGQTLALSDAAAADASPSAVLHPNGTPRVFIVSASDRKIREVYYKAGYEWVVGPPLTGSETVAAGTSPSSVVRADHGVRVYYVANSDHKVHEFGYNPVGSPGEGWGINPTPVSTSTVRAGASPSAFMNTTGLPRVYFVAADNKVHETGYNGATGWTETAALSTTTVAPNSSPSAFAMVGGGVRLYYISAAQTLREINYTGTWTDYLVTTSGPIAANTSPSAFLNTNGATRIYVVANSDKKVHELAYASGAWTDLALPATSTVALGTNPDSYAWPSGGSRVYYVDQNNQVAELAKNATGSWVESRNLTPGHVATGTSPSAIFYQDTTAPTASVSGGLYDARNQASMTNGTVTVTASDDYSGVAQIKLSIDGSQAPGSWSRTCETRPCIPTTAGPWSTTIDPGALNWATGTHTLTLDITDSAGNVKTMTWTVHYYRTSWAYGNANHTVDTDAEADQVVSAYQSASISHGDAANIMPTGLNPAEQPLADVALRRTIGGDGSLLLSLGEFKVYNYAGGRLRYLEDSIGRSLGANMDGAKRMTTSSLASFPHDSDIGNYNISWNYGGTDRAVNLDAEVAAVIAQYNADPSDAAVNALFGGLAPSDLARVSAAIPSVENPGAASGADAGVDGQDVSFLDGDPLANASSTDPFDNNLCPSSSPCGSYNGAAAAAYAHNYYGAQNSAYPDYHADNCTNFVSQALRAGGFQFLRYNRATSSGVTGPGSWWVDKLTPSPATWKPSKSWSVAPVLYQHLVSTGLGSEIPGPTRSFRPGDVLFYDLHGTGIDHASMITTVKSGQAWFAQSGARRYEGLYADQMVYILSHYSHFGGIRVVRPKYTAATI